MNDKKSFRHTMTRLDYLTIKLMKMGQKAYTNDVLKLHKVKLYEEVPQDVADTVADIFEERIKDLEEHR